MSVRPKCPFPFDKIVVSSTAPLYPACKNNKQTRSGLARVCAKECIVPLGGVSVKRGVGVGVGVYLLFFFFKNADLGLGLGLVSTLTLT